MGYSHGFQWTENAIENTIKKVMTKAKIKTMPSHTIMNEITGDKALSSAISRHGGTKYWADKLNLTIEKCESKMGYEYECKCKEFLESQFGFNCELTKAGYPYDILVNGNIKIDVKCGNLCRDFGNKSYYTFNLEKKNPTCDIYICYCLDNEFVKKVYVIPSCVMSGKTQLSVGAKKSKYDKYINAWKVVMDYDDFYINFLMREAM